MEKFDIKGFVKKFAPYFVNYFAGIGMSLLFVVALNIPMRFLKLGTPVAYFLVGALGAVITMYVLSFRKGYNSNSRTYKYRHKEVLMYIACVFAVQIVLTLLIGPAVYIAGPTMWVDEYIGNVINTTPLVSNWILMLLADIFLYTPAMLYGEYRGAKEHLKDFITDVIAELADFAQ